ncbi:MAG: CoA pyrophosphatase [Bacteroidales bacterium]|nr:MAG: CoA pyrophosphatase [Bacteroidales bacterium]
MELEEILKRFEDRLHGELPGQDAHLKMAPSDRIRGIYPATPNNKTSQGAVLILLYAKEGSINTFLIKRPTYRGAHSDQISFPGGKSEKGDGSLINTAIREAEEEIGVVRGAIRIHGTLSPLFIPVSNIRSNAGCRKYFRFH